MILTCPSCAAQFKIAPEALGATGRTVRCGKCKNQWHATRPLITLPADDLKFPAADAKPVTVDAETPKASVTQNTIAQDPIPSPPEPSTLSASKFTAAPFSNDDDDVSALAAALQDDPAMQGVAKRNAVIAAVLLAGLLSIPVFMMQHKDDAAAPPEKAAPEKTAQLPEVKKEDKEIVLDGTPTTLLKEEVGRTILSIEGALINKTDKTLPVPILQAQALNAKGKVVKEWIIPIANKEMEPGQRQTFTYSMPFSEQGVVDIAFHFL